MEEHYEEFLTTYYRDDMELGVKIFVHRWKERKRDREHRVVASIRGTKASQMIFLFSLYQFKTWVLKFDVIENPFSSRKWFLGHPIRVTFVCSYGLCSEVLPS